MRRRPRQPSSRGQRGGRTTKTKTAANEAELVAARAQSRGLVDVVLGRGLGLGVRGGVLARQPGREVPSGILVVGRDRGGGELGGAGGGGGGGGARAPRSLQDRLVDGGALGRRAALRRPGPRPGGLGASPLPLPRVRCRLGIALRPLRV